MYAARGKPCRAKLSYQERPAVPKVQAAPVNLKKVSETLFDKRQRPPRIRLSLAPPGMNVRSSGLNILSPIAAAR